MEGHWLGTKVSSHFRAIWPRKKRKSKWKKWITTLCFLNACLSVPTSHAFHPLPSFPTWLRQRGVSNGYPFLHASFLTPCFCLMFLSPSIHPFFVPSLPSLCFCPLFLYLFDPFFPSFHPHSSVWSTVLSPAKHSCSLPVTGQKKADIQLCMSYYWRLMWENTVQGLTRWKSNIAALKPISFPPVEFVTSETFF